MQTVSLNVVVRSLHSAMWFLAATLFLPAVDSMAAQDEAEIGTWVCSFAFENSCPMDGLGRGHEDFWTYPYIEKEDKIDVRCRIDDPQWDWSKSENCEGRWRGPIAGMIVTTPFGAVLVCPKGYVRKRGQCIEIEKPKSDTNCAIPAGSPVDAATGQNIQTVIDWTSPVPAAGTARQTAGATASRLQLTRTYSSHYPGLNTPSTSRLGNGWRTNFDWVATWDRGLHDTSFVTIRRPDSTEIYFVNQNGAWRPRLPVLEFYIEYKKPDPTTTETLSVAPTGITLRTAKGTNYVFNEKGQLTRITEPDGYTQTLIYTGDLNTRVTDSRGQWLNFVYGPPGSAWAGLLVVTQGSDGSLTRYSYEDRSQAGYKPKNRMSSGTNQWALKSVIYPDATSSIADNPRTVYEYLDNMYRPYLITTVVNRPSINPSTWTTTTWTYDVKKRVTSAERSIGKKRWQYAYNDTKQQVTVTDPQGRQMLYSRQVGSDGLTRVSLLGMSMARPRSTAVPLPKSPRSIIDDLICWLGKGCPPDSCPIDGEERCKVVKDHCIMSCDFTLDNAALQDLQSMYFNRCVQQCRFDFMCEGIDYPNDGWDQGKLGTPRPWLNMEGLSSAKTIRRIQ